MFGLILLVSCIPHRPSPALISSERQSIELPQSTFSENIIRHSAYAISFNPKTLIPNWVAYELTADETDGPWTRKGHNFMPDPDYNGIQPDHNDYKGSGYSRGHLAPAGDMKWDSLAMVESFYFTNCIPQDKELNNGRWNQLEMKVRTWAKEYGQVYIVCGPAFLNIDTLRIGHNRVAVPDACFKALLIPTSTSYSAIAFVMRNGEEKRNLKECSCTIDQLETLLGLDLFYNLPDRVETGVESSICWYNWGL